MSTLENIQKQIQENPIILYMKGSPNTPQCGFSQRASQAIMACGQRFAYVDILSTLIGQLFLSFGWMVS